MNSLTREDAIKRIKDIKEDKSCDHLKREYLKLSMYENQQDMCMSLGATYELMAIFDIKEAELI